MEYRRSEAWFRGSTSSNRRLGAPQALVFKVPTADLESDAPLRPDEDAYGVTYDEIDDFLEGKAIAGPSRDRILAAHRASAHKRSLPVTPQDWKTGPSGAR